MIMLDLSYESSLFFILTVTATSLALFAWSRRPTTNASQTAWLTLTIALWTFALAMEAQSVTLEAKLLWLRAEYLAQAATPAIAYLIALNHTGQKTRITKHVYLALGAMTALTLGILIGSFPWIIASAELETVGMTTRLILKYGGWFWMLQLYAYLLFSYCTAILLTYIWRSPQPYREQSISILLALLLPLGSNLLYVLKISKVDMTPFAAVFSGGILTWNLTQYHLFDIIAAGRETVTRDMAEGFIVMDALGRIRELNPAAARALGTTAADLREQTAADLPALAPLRSLLEAARSAETHLLIEAAQNCRHYRTTVTPLLNRRQQCSGHVIVLQDITAQEQARMALEAEERRYGELFERVPAGIFRAQPGGVFLEANTAMAHILGAADRQTLLQHPVSEFYGYLENPEPWMQALETHPGIVQNLELQLRRLDQQPLWVSMSVQATHGADGKILYYDGVIEDITRRKLAEMELRASEQRNRAILQALPDLMFVIDIHGICHEWYATNTDLLAAPPEQLVGRNMRDILPMELALEVVSCCQKVFESSEISILEYSLQFGETKRYFEARIVPYVNEKTLSIVRDITERKIAEEQSRAYAARLEILHELERAIIEAQAPQTIAQVALRRIREWVPSQGCNMVLLNPQGSEAVVFANDSDFDPPLMHMGMRITLRPPLLEQENALKLRKGQVVLFTRPQEQLHLISEITASRKEHVRAALIVPLNAQGTLIGTINLTSAEAFTDAHIAMVSEIASSLAIGIQQAQLREQAQRETAAKTTLLEDVKHRVNGYFLTILSLLTREQHRVRKVQQQLQSECPDPVQIAETYEIAIAQLIQRVEGLETVHKMLSKTQWKPISLHALAAEVIHTTLRALPDEQYIILDVTPSSVRVDAKSASSLALILHELTTNTIKYALGNRPKGRIMISISTEPPVDDSHHTPATMICLEFRDDGPGYPEPVLQMQNIDVGLQLIQAMVQRDLRGRLILRNDGGALAEISFRAKEQENALEFPAADTG